MHFLAYEPHNDALHQFEQSPNLIMNAKNAYIKTCNKLNTTKSKAVEMKRYYLNHLGMASKFEWKNVGAAEFIQAYNENCSEDGFFPSDDSMIYIFKFKPEYAEKLDQLGFLKPDDVSDEPGSSLANWDDELKYEIDSEGFVYLSFLFMDYRGEESEEFIMSYLDKDMLVEKDAVELG